MTRMLLIFGALAGYVLTFISGTLASSPLHHVLRDALFGALIGAFLGRMFASLCLSMLNDARSKSKTATQSLKGNQT